jgi:hypothetical protein
MKNMIIWFSVPVLFPVMLEASPNDFGKTRLGIAIGTGHFVRSEFENDHEIDFMDAGLYADYEFSPSQRAGVRGSIASYSEKGTSELIMILGPYTDTDWGFLGVRAGVSFLVMRNSSDAEYLIFPFPNLNLRIGPQNVFYFSYHLFDAWPIYSGGGWVRFEFGLTALSSTSLWFGIGGIPQIPPDVFLFVEQRLTKNYFLKIGGQLGGEENYGLSLRLTYSSSK